MLKERESSEGSPGTPDECAGCGGRIQDRYYLLAVDRQWHGSCLRCCECRLPLDTELTCFSRDGNIYCKEDYYRLFCVKRCARCGNGITANELVMRAREMVYHLTCFTCVACGTLLSKGDVFGMRDGLVYCRPHYDSACLDEYCDEDVNSVYRCQEIHSEGDSPSQFYSGGTSSKGRPRKRKIAQGSPEDLQVQTMRMASTALEVAAEVNMNGERRVATPSPNAHRQTDRASRSRERSARALNQHGRTTRSRSRCSRGRPSRATRSRSPILLLNRSQTGNTTMRSRSRHCSSPLQYLRYIGERKEDQYITTHRRDQLRSRSPSRASQLPVNEPETRRSYSFGSRRSPSPAPRDSRSREPELHHSRSTGDQHRTSSHSGMSRFVNSEENNPFKQFMQFMNSFAKHDSFHKLHFDKNMVPEFDPSVKNHRIENWISKVNECAQIYGWSEQQTSHFALPRLVGHAKKWYEGLLSINRSWTEWQECLKRAFPSESNYGVLLSEMLARRYKPGESLDDYYYEKMVLINACDIKHKKAVDCIIHGIDDRTIRASASSARFANPEDLLGYLKDMCRDNPIVNSKFSRNKQLQQNDLVCTTCKKPGHHFKQCRSNLCYNCKQFGHKISQCTLPVNKCDTCHKIGHKSEDCYVNKNNQSSQANKGSAPKPVSDKRVMIAETTNTNLKSKFYKMVRIDDFLEPILSFIDFGSDCSLITIDLVRKFNLKIDKDNIAVIKGVGESRIVPIGKTQFTLMLDDTQALITAYVVISDQLHVPILIGQNFTELPNILVVKTNDALHILNRNMPTELPEIEHEQSNIIKLYVVQDTVLHKDSKIVCYTNDISNCDIFVPSGYRNCLKYEYWVQEGVFKIVDGKTCLFVTTPCENIKIQKDTLISRANIIDTIETTANQDETHCYNIQSYEIIEKSEIKLNPNLQTHEINKIYDLIDKHRKTFAQNLAELGCTDITEMEIQLSDKTPVVYRPYRLSYKERETVKNMVSELIQNDIVEESTSSYASPILLVSKKTGGQRLCIDYRALNSKTIKEHFPLPRIEDQLDQLSGSKYFTSLDLTSGYYQIPLKQDSRHLTAFITPDGLYQFKRMPFGLVNAPAVFQRTISKALSLCSGNPGGFAKPALAYMDDLLITSKNFDEGLEKLENTIETLDKANLTLNLKKCSFFQENIDYLGYDISSEGIKPGKAKIEAVQNFPSPKNVHEVRQFIGLASYFRKFIQNFALIARPLTDLTKKDHPWKWSDEQISAFNTLKEKLVQRPVLALYNPNYITELHTDASKIGIAGILLQKESDSAPLKPVAYFSRKTTIDEQKFHAYDLETLAVVTSLNRFRVYLLGTTFTIITDCNALRATFTKRDILPRIARWWLILQEYDCNIIYRPNTNMTHVDALSRNPIPANSSQTDLETTRVMNITQEDWLLSLQLTDPKLCHIREVLEDPKYSEIVDIKQNFIIKDNKLFRKAENDELKWVVPKGARWQICRQNHDDIGHFSVEKTLTKIKKDFWFPKMKKFIVKYVKSCVHCAYGKDTATKKEGFLHPIPKTNIPFNTVHVDHLGPFVKSSRGNMYLLLVVDGFTKFCIIKPLRNLKSNLTIKALTEIFSTFGFPERLISDRGSSFTAKEFENFCRSSHVKHILNAVASPRANGQVERYNRTVLNALSSYTDKLGESKWDQELGKIQWGLNNTLNKGIGKTPSEALFGRSLTSSSENVFSDIFPETRVNSKDINTVRSEVSAHISDDQLKQKTRFDKKRKVPNSYSVGDLVKIRKQINSNDGSSKKLLPIFSGPYKISKILDNDRYEVSSIEGSGISKRNYCNVWAVDQIQPWINVHINNINSSDSE